MDPDHGRSLSDELTALSPTSSSKSRELEAALKLLSSPLRGQPLQGSDSGARNNVLSVPDIP